MILTGRRGGGGSGGVGGAGSTTTYRVPFAFDTPNLDVGYEVYVPTVGDVLYDIWIEVITAWDGTTPEGQPGFFTSGYQGFWGNGVDMTIAGGTQDALLYSAPSPVAWQPGRFLFTYPLCVAVSQDGEGGTPLHARVFGDQAPSTPLTVVAGVNDEFVFTGDGGAGTPETFTVAPGTYATLAACATAMNAAVGSVSSEAFSTIVSATDGGGIIQLAMVAAGSSENGNKLTFGGNDVAADMGFTGNPNEFLSGQGGDPGATQGTGALYFIIGTPA